jgi:hypothetical protein
MVKITNLSLCKCGHAFWIHNYPSADGENVPMPGMNKQCTSAVCQSGPIYSFCSCMAFQLDNLLYLEQVLDERSDK